MTKFALYVPLQAKPGREKEVAEFLRSAVPLVNAEPGTISWFAIQETPSRIMCSLSCCRPAKAPCKEAQPTEQPAPASGH
jgi:hypothetical protein